MWLEAFSIIIELSHKILWEEFRIKTNHKGRLRIAAFQSYNSKDYDTAYVIVQASFLSFFVDWIYFMLSQRNSLFWDCK